MLECRFYVLEDYLLNICKIFKNLPPAKEQYNFLINNDRLFLPCIYEYKLQTKRSLSAVNRLLDTLTKIDCKSINNVDNLLSACMVEVKVEKKFIQGGIL